MARRKPSCLLRIALGAAGLALGLAAGAAWWVRRETAPLPAGEAFYVRFAADTDRVAAFKTLAARPPAERTFRNLAALEFWSRWRNAPATVREGTYELRPGMSADQLLAALRRPVRQNVRIPEGWWIRRVAARLEARGVCSAEEYIAAANDAARFAAETKPPIPREGSLEGFLFPDTYDLPPLLGAEGVVRRQLRAFQQKVAPVLPPEADVRRTLTVASMVELEAALDRERPMVAGVIENRLDRRMTLDIDATVLYALQEWKVLGPGVVRTVESEYNTYLNRGLPPGPIGSPGLASIQAALAPAEHDYLFYVARPDRSHIFTRDYAAHRAAIRRARAEHRAAEAAREAEAGS